MYYNYNTKFNNLQTFMDITQKPIFFNILITAITQYCCFLAKISQKLFYFD